MRTSAPPRKRRRPPKSDWQFPGLTGMGLKPQQQRLLVIIGCVAAVLLAATGMVALLTNLGSGATAPPLPAGDDPPPGQARPAEFQGWVSPKLFAPIADRGQDAKPLTAKELFGAKTLAVSKKVSLKLAAQDLTPSCATITWGRELIDQVSAAGCSQAARGLYVSSDQRYIAQYTVLNLRDVQAADELVQSLKTLYLGGWVQPLPYDKVPFPSHGHTEGAAYALGHYVGLVWLARTDGAERGAKDDFSALGLALRAVEKPLYRRIVAITGPGTS
ncbi:MAG: hypothetical protein HOV86_22770 [Thermoactinospora sp.]|nr:hypothetical protein [Thermoactinospora sp.]